MEKKLNDKDEAYSKDLLSRANSELNNQKDHIEKCVKFKQDYVLFQEMLKLAISNEKQDLAEKIENKMKKLESEFKTHYEAYKLYKYRYNRIKKEYQVLFQREITG